MKKFSPLRLDKLLLTLLLLWKLNLQARVTKKKKKTFRPKPNWTLLDTT